jgi:hypothetical protein
MCRHRSSAGDRVMQRKARPQVLGHVAPLVARGQHTSLRSAPCERRQTVAKRWQRLPIPACDPKASLPFEFAGIGDGGTPDGSLVTCSSQVGSMTSLQALMPWNDVPVANSPLRPLFRRIPRISCGDCASAQRGRLACQSANQVLAKFCAAKLVRGDVHLSRRFARLERKLRKHRACERGV